MHLGHRASVDFDFFSNAPFDPDGLSRTLSYRKDSERLQIAPNTLTCRVDRGGPVLVSFFGGLGLGQVAARELVQAMNLHVASLFDIAGTKMKAVQDRAEEKDYLYVDALLRHGLDLAACLAAALVVYGRSFNPLLTLKALSYFDDVPSLSREVGERLRHAVEATDLTLLPALPVFVQRDQTGETLWIHFLHRPSCWQSPGGWSGLKNPQTPWPILSTSWLT